MKIILLLILFSTLSCSSELTDISRQNSKKDTMVDDLKRDLGKSRDAQSSFDLGLDMSVDTARDLTQDIIEKDAESDLEKVECDYQFVDGILVIEAESLPLIEDWNIESTNAGFTGIGYLVWRGATYGSDPSHGQLEIKILVPEAGRYKFQWHTRVGTGNDATEHNDSWIKFVDAKDYFGLRQNSTPESRRYPKPQCDDAQFIADKTASATVGDARCAAGSSKDGWMKVYSSGALDWRWATFTSDNDASEIFVEFDAPGVYILGLAARAESHQIDRMVLSAASVDDTGARDLTNAETKCE